MEFLESITVKAGLNVFIFQPEDMLSYYLILMNFSLHMLTNVMLIYKKMWTNDIKSLEEVCNPEYNANFEAIEIN